MMRIGLTMGDPAGIGPEIILKALREDHGHELVIYGSPGALQRDAAALNLPMAEAAIVDVTPEIDGSAIPWGAMDARAARIQLAALEAAMDAADRGELDAIVTAPWNKASFATIGHPQCGHTEVLAARYDAPEHVMMLAGDRLRVALVTVHVALKDVAARITPARLGTVIRTTVTGLQRQFGIAEPHLGVCALNPHAGEHGVMGTEELEVIAPTLVALRAELSGVRITGPLPSDTLFARFAGDGQPYDAVVCMYHDQGLIPLKTLHFGQSANITLGLPIIRTSVDHGTAYDIAGEGLADASSLVYALRTAADLAMRSRLA